MQSMLTPHHDARADIRAALSVAARITNIVLGLWMFSSSWLFAESRGAHNEARIVGLAIAVASTIGFWRDEARFVVAGLAIFLGFSATGVWALHGAPMWNQLLVAFAVFVLALLPALRPSDEQP